MTPRPPARLFLLPAKEKPVVIVLRRGPSRWVHVMKWNTLTDEIEHGSWFRGRIYEDGCDVSFDGEFFAYHATGHGRDKDGDNHWQGICRPPRLTTIADTGFDSYSPTPVWFEADQLSVCCAESLRASLAGTKVPFHIVETGRVYPYSSLEDRLMRDGWRLNVIHLESFRWTAREWRIRPTKRHPELVLLQDQKGHHFSMPEMPGIVDERTTSAAFDCQGCLVTGREGVLTRYTLKDLKRGSPTFRYDTNVLEAPKRAIVNEHGMG